ncbi:MAG: SUMF1/EgtB/PvdO family nonheme iron enzyme [Proteobacteria bacterium]|nr:SUMF1/EgtB/PvdO family nonheme iron enzyme [Pseudomonadota bacterium]
MNTGNWDQAQSLLRELEAAQAGYRDSKALLARVERELHEIERKARLSELYEQGVAHIQAEKWREAHQALAALVAEQAEFRDAANLLAIVEPKRNLAELYEQARQLHLSEQWQRVVEVFSQIGAIDAAYPDSEGLLQSARQALAATPAPGRQRRWLGMLLVVAVAIALVLGISLSQQDKEPEVSKPTGSATGVQYTALAKKAPMRFISLAGGTFRMGTPENEKYRDDDEVLHEVEVSPFAIAEKEVTQRQWELVMGKNPSDCRNNGCSPDRPVQKVSWRDVIEFLNKLSEREQLTPCYSGTEDEIEWNQKCDGFRLPTEAEWEYACRAGSQTVYSFGDDVSQLGEYAWYGEDSSTSAAHPVGGKKPNDWGLYDMHSNVWEWVWDWYGPYAVRPSGEVSVNPSRPENVAEVDVWDPQKEEVVKGRVRTLRGGSFGNGSRFLRCGGRSRFRPTDVDRDTGFRAVWARPRQH